MSVSPPSTCLGVINVLKSGGGSNQATRSCISRTELSAHCSVSAGCQRLERYNFVQFGLCVCAVSSLLPTCSGVQQHAGYTNDQDVAKAVQGLVIICERENSYTWVQSPS
jgi:hypothetical protein